MSLPSLSSPPAPGTGRRGQVLSVNCPSREVLQHVTSRWGILVLLVLLKGTHRFGELRQNVGGVSEKMLTQSLRALENDGFVLRQSYDEVSPRVEYSLTSTGVEVALHVEALTDWIEGNLPRILGDGAATATPKRQLRQAPR
jgi:DNA-binding HxlR family transcriptional regulator